MAKKQKSTPDEFMESLDHPLKSEVQAVREIIRGLNPAIGERVKWNAPSYFYNDADMLTFNLWAKDRVHLVFHHPLVVMIDSRLLEGDYPTRRMMYFSDTADIQAKRPELERVIGKLIEMIDEPPIGG